MSRRVGIRGDGFCCAVVIVIVILVVVARGEGFFVSALEAAEVCLGELSSLCAVVMSRLRSEMSGSSGLGQREDVEMVLRLQS